MDGDFLRIPGMVFVAIGLVFLLTSFSGITGFVVDGEVEADYGYFIGIVFAIAGLLLWISGGEMRQAINKSRESVVADSNEIKAAASKDYREKYGRNPVANELISYVKRLQESGEIRDVVLKQRRKLR